MILADSTGFKESSGEASNVGKKAMNTPEIHNISRTVKYAPNGITQSPGPLPKVVQRALLRQRFLA
jgi:hypothetical protein